MSADSIEIRLVKVESDIRRIDALSEPRFERIEKALAKLTEIAERQNVEIGRLAVEIAKVEAGVLREINAMTVRFIGWLAVVATLAVAALKYLP